MNFAMSRWYFGLLGFLLAVPQLLLAAGDLSLTRDNITFEPQRVLAGKSVRIYVDVRNLGKDDMLGRVQIFDETAGVQIGVDQPVSAVAGGQDTIFLDWVPLVGERRLRFIVVPLTEDTNVDNNQVVLMFFADTDFDGDGVGDAQDTDDDNDGVPDRQDAFPKNPREWQDTDGDGTGDNADTDDDNDGVPDAEELQQGTSPYLQDTDGDGASDKNDVFPLDKTEWQDTDDDGVGNNADPDDDGDGVLDENDPLPQNHAPVPEIQNFRPVVKTAVGEILAWDATQSRDPDGEITAAVWDFGDGTRAEDLLGTHSYELPGTFTAKLALRDDAGEWMGKFFEVEVRQHQDSFYVILGGLGIIFLVALGVVLYSLYKIRRARPRNFHKVEIKS